MLATLSEEFPSGDWLYEIKFDGYRALAFCKNNIINLISRNEKSFNDKFYPLVTSLKELKLNAVLDGEITVVNKKGIASFENLQDWRSEADGELVYQVFDVLWLQDYDLRQCQLIERKQLLKEILPKNGVIQYSDFFYQANPQDLLNEARKQQLEGIIAKRADSVYASGLRSKNWLKIKAMHRQEVVIGGVTMNENTPKLFSSILVGVYEKNRFNYIGKVGTGFKTLTQQNLMKKFTPLKIETCPFTITPDINKPSRFNPNPPAAQVIWLQPELVCEVTYLELSRDGIMRHPAFKGLRDDKDPRQVYLEIADRPENNKNPLIKINKPKKNERKTLVNPKENTQVKIINNREIKFKNLNKMYWPNEGYTKADLINYYYQAAEYILPYLMARPQTLNRFPNGIYAKSFYQKDITKVAPSWIKQFPYRTSLGEDKNYLIVENEADLYWMVNLGVIEINPWSSTIRKQDYPTWCMIDIDPSDANTFDEVIKTAIETKKVLSELNINSYCKTSGASGLHIYIPLANKYSYAESQLLGRLIAKEVNQRVPGFTSVERFTVNRTKRIYIDFLQNRPKATIAAPYSVRPKPFATVSMPLHWEEVKKGLKPTRFTLKNAIERMKSEGDFFKPVLGKGINLTKMIKLLKEI